MTGYDMNNPLDLYSCKIYDINTFLINENLSITGRSLEPEDV
jgi:hypothetical protein